MTPELAYFLKINVAIALFYAFYRLFFHKDTFFHWRRMALLCFFAISMLYPLLNIQGWIKAHEPMVAMADLYATIILPEQVVTPLQEPVMNWQEFIMQARESYLLERNVITSHTFLRTTGQHHPITLPMLKKQDTRSTRTSIKEKNRPFFFLPLDIHTPTITYGI